LVEMTTIGHSSGVSGQTFALQSAGKPSSCPGSKTSTFVITNRFA